MMNGHGLLEVLHDERVMLELVEGFVLHLVEDLVRILLERRLEQQRAVDVCRGRRRLTCRVVAPESRRYGA